MKKISILTNSDVEKIYDSFKEKRADIGTEFALAVVDSHGELIFFIKTDNSPVSVGPIAVNKAFTAARDWQKSSSLSAASSEFGFDISSLGDIRYTGLSGGVPIFIDDYCIGAVGVSGMSQAEDENTAEEFIGLLN